MTLLTPLYSRKFQSYNTRFILYLAPSNTPSPSEHVLLLTQSSTLYSGVLVSSDGVGNVVLEDAVEIREGEGIQVGVLVVRGDDVCFGQCSTFLIFRPLSFPTNKSKATKAHFSFSLSLSLPLPLPLSSTFI